MSNCADERRDLRVKRHSGSSGWRGLLRLTAVLRDPVLRLSRDHEVGLARPAAFLLADLVGAPDPRAQVRRQLVPMLGAAPLRRRHLAIAAGPVAIVLARLRRSADVLDLLVNPRRLAAAADDRVIR
jgi:hypothetical protein